MRAAWLLVVVAWAAFAQTWKAGVAQAVITPAEPIWMAGYGDRKVAELLARTAP